MLTNIFVTKHVITLPDADERDQVELEVQISFLDKLEIKEVKIIGPNVQRMTMTETQFLSIIPGAEEVIKSAFEYIAETWSASS